MTNSTNGPPVDPVAGKTLAEILGEIAWLMSQHSETRSLPLTELERIVMPAIMLKQFHITYARVLSPKLPGGNDSVKQPEETLEALQPMAVETYAMVSVAVATALDANPDLKLTLQDWRSGPTKRVMLQLALKDVSP